MATVADAATVIAEVAAATKNYSFMNTFGQLYRITTFGESHGKAIGGVIDGMPPGIAVDLDFIQHQLDRRRPGQSRLTTARKEADRIEILSGTFEGRTTGQPIGFVVYNTNQHSSDYENMRNLFRPSHADFTYTAKYGIRDHRGGGRSSARENISRVVGGAFAMLALKELGISIKAYTQQVGTIALEGTYKDYNLERIEDSDVRCPDEETARRMEELIMQVKAKGDTVGGVIACVIQGCPVGWGEPSFDKLHARLGYAMLGINAVKGFEYGMGFNGASQFGSQQNDIFIPDGNGGITTLTNNSGGIQGGISNGQDIYFRVAFKPVATLLQAQHTVTQDGQPVTLKARGRHDACVLPRAVPVVEAMAAITLLDHCLLANSKL